VVITAGTGDYGYGTAYPAASPYVTAVGGTTLTRDPATKRGWTETAWYGSGSGCSSFEPKPAWQHDSGCPDRTEADVSAFADPLTGVAVYDSYPNPEEEFVGIGWLALGGTSVATPIIASTYALAGTPLPGTNPASYPYADPSALNNITSGSNTLGTCTPRYLCTAGPGYNGPTGLGTPDGVAAFTLPHGDIAGTVTSASGQPLAGAVVRAGAGSAVTGPGGHYELSVPAGGYTVSALDLSGYASTSRAGVRIAAGQAVTENFALSPAPDVTVSGTVTDGSGHGWPVYAKVTVPGTTAAGYTSPNTGRYTLNVPRDGTYTVQAGPVSAGYQQAGRTVTTAAGNRTVNLSVQANLATCSAAGYRSVPVSSQNFNKDTRPPGWTVVTKGARAATWKFGTDVDGIHNLTGGTGGYAMAIVPDPYTQSANTELISAPVNLATNPYPELRFDYADSTGAGRYDEDATAEVDVSTDGGRTWSAVWSYSGGSDTGGPALVAMPQAAGHASVELRFRYIWAAGAVGSIPIYWQIDNVAVSACRPSPGGLVVGRVTDGNTGQGIAGATVTADGRSATSMATPGDPSAGGLYTLFPGKPGSQRVTASAPGYTTAAHDVAVTASGLTRASFTLGAGRLSVAPGSVAGTAVMGGTATATVTVKNTGTLPVRVGISSRPGGFAPLGESAARAARGTPLLRVPGDFAAQPWSGSRELATHAAKAADSAPPGGGSWVSMSGLPYAPWGMATAADPGTGTVYAFGGTGPLFINNTGQTVLADAYALNPANGDWTRLPGMPHARTDAQAAFIGGKVYLAGGFDNDGNGVPSLDVYNPATRQWSAGAAPPHSYAAAAAAVLNGKMYIVGGCDQGNGQCGETTVQVYDAATDTWSTAAPYPIPVSDQSCGAIAGKLYCAGGWSLTQSTSAGYVYDPGSNSWHPILSMPADVYNAAYAVADGELLISGGAVDDGTVVTNQGFGYDPAAGTWSPLPNAPELTYLAAGACGFYAIGGGYGGGEYAAQLPGYGDCGGDPWLSASRSALTLAPGQATTITVTLSTRNTSITQPGRYAASLEFATDTPYGTRSVPVTLTATPPKTWGQVRGTVRGRVCNGPTEPVAGATVQVSGSHGNWLLGTGSSGTYGLWLDTSNDPLTLIVTAAGWQSQAATVNLKALTATTRNFTLTKSGQCG
jgi:hypothetical protein